MNQKFGFMQGRLSPIIDNKIQSFPSNSWREELVEAQSIGFQIMEWTIDYDGIYENPLMSKLGRANIRHEARRNAVSIPSVTGDCFMQSPFWKASNSIQQRLKKEFLDVISASSALGIRHVVVPLVDEGALCSQSEEDTLINFLLLNKKNIAKKHVTIVFESDYEPQRLAKFINLFPADVFGINYDTGNSAALGFCPIDELSLYGERVYNVHVKDRVLGGCSVSLGNGNAQIGTALKKLQEIGYEGNFIFQTARSTDGDHRGVLVQSKIFLETVLSKLNHD